MREPLSRQDLARLERLFDIAVELAPAERAAFVAAECGANEGLRRELQSLLDALDAEDRLGALRPAAPSRAGTRIGPYELLQKVGEGGMGEVYLAEQQAPVKRRVALKLIKLGMDTRRVITRFAAERQTLALMDHPWIARVLDAGTSEAGQPYFVMEYIEGPSILEHCDRERLGIPERLRLFAGVCQAIQHAHQKGVIHRDVKPSNVRVTTLDGRVVPKVIDFGIAKALHGEGAPQEQLTHELQRLGTPAYMSPEQAGLGGLDVDTRSDVYSLGVLLYELLTGTTPLDSRRVAEGDVLELLRAICEETPLRPSACVSAREAPATSSTPDRNRGRHLQLALRGDLDWIVMKCLEKDRARRYTTAKDLAEDIERYLRHEPVSAGPPSATYRLRKFVRRNRAGVLMASSLALILVVGAVGTVWGLLRAIDAEERAEGEAQTARDAQARERERANELQQVADFQAERLGEVDAMTMGVRLRRGLLDEVPEARRELLTEAIAGVNFTNIASRSLEENLFHPALDAIDEEFEDEPLVRAQLLNALAEAMTGVGLLERATDPQERALELRERELGPGHRETLVSMDSMGSLLLQQGRLPEARSTVAAALEGLRRVVGEDDPATLTAMAHMGRVLKAQGQYQAAEPYYASVLDGLRRTKGDDDPATLIAMDEMGSLRAAQLRLPEAESWARRAYDGARRVLGEQHRDTLKALGNLASILYLQRRFAEAATCARDVYEGVRLVLGDDHPETFVQMDNLGSMLAAQNEYAEAESLTRAALEGQRRVLGDDHPDTLTTTFNLGFVHHLLGQPREAVPYFRAAFEGCRRTLGEDHPSTLRCEANLGRSSVEAGGSAEAVLLLEHVLLTTEDPELRPWVAEYLAEALAREGDLEGARAVLREREEEARDTFPEASVELADQLYQIGSLFLFAKDWVEAEAILRECIRIREQAHASDWTTSDAKGRLGYSLMCQSRFAEAEVQMLAGYEGLVRDVETMPVGSRSMALPRAANNLVWLYSAWERAEPGKGHGDQVPRWKAIQDQYGVDLPQPPDR